MNTSNIEDSEIVDLNKMATLPLLILVYILHEMQQGKEAKHLHTSVQLVN